MNRPIAYFCAEYALSDELQIYAGGLGVLAGDYVREAGDSGLPFVAVGLYYAGGFVHKELSNEGLVVDLHNGKRPEDAGLILVKDETGAAVKVKIPIAQSIVTAQIWLYKYKTAKVYLLDTKVSENSEADQRITETLYITDKEVRLKQEIVLGIGGLRALLSMDIHPSFYHLNEGHSALLIYELIHHEMKEHNLDFDGARARVRERVLFTNHTLVTAGNDVFSNDLVSLLLTKYAQEIEIPVKQLVDLGLVQQSSTFSMTILAMRAADRVNAVSKLHAKKAKEIWSDHPMTPITNGIHLPTWDRVGDNEMWSQHQVNKQKLLQVIKEQTGMQWGENDLLLGWGRRMARYKRPLALVERLKQFGEMARDNAQPIRVVFAGIAHPADTDGKELLEELQYRLSSDLSGVAVYLPHYNLELASLMTSGCDVWINTPVVGFEACGTSGMKAALNGVLPLSTRDGWMDEVEMYGVGWALTDTDLTQNMLDTLSDQILPLYYAKKESGIPEQWVGMMKNARELIQNEFSMSRAMKQYLELINYSSS
ncbi:alpha-glucan family phosphorylase [Candidatus Woesebacteria bacterium]|nr:alpha-glucan family phosphorylase [Candidatus Woesebacteria bacterium]